MHHIIQRGKVRSQVINIPEGLPELLSDITREVLRCQPTTECLCQFIIDYLHSLIVSRNKANIAKSIIDRALNIVDEVIADMCICDIPKAKSDYMCEAMEECFRRFLAQRRCEKGKDKEIIKFNEVDMLDELIQKCKFTEDELNISRPVIEAAYEKFANAYMSAKDSAEGTDSLYQYFREREMKRINERLRIKAAIKIQSSFRGYLTRKSLFVGEHTKIPSPVLSETEFDQMQIELAARKIQQFFRRHLSFNKNKNEGDQLQDPCSPSSKFSLTANPADQPADRPADHPADHQDVHQDKPYEDTQNAEIMEELKPVANDDNVIEDQHININEEDAAEAEPINNDETVELQAD